MMRMFIWKRNAGVLTKLDIMDPGTDARGVLDGREVKLKHGWAAVVNRGQQDINANASMQVQTSCRHRAVHDDADVLAPLLCAVSCSVSIGMHTQRHCR